ncbi:hydroxymethylbilane synthase [Dyadobacter jejuensis]|uniref:Porphobilinogen deaminase n=1 Tax=Dyadobacter jejuensis TaxID=1082580 RepID=A0A316AJP3_9BACT|nr:hydroxymethylbilane synthase [Dyadobacter jejuensis]PWJ57558.1 hydroxymethylbilane synthase [Dyadobacter jejuensis]
MKQIRIGTRGSKLALWQAYYVQDRLQAHGMESEIVIIDTKGDQILDRSLSKIGSKGVFTEELEVKLGNGDIDLAVHSAKDMQSSLDEAFELIAFTPREKTNDVLLSSNKALSLESGVPFVIGTSSTRRIATLKSLYPHIKTVDMRGNLQTRIKKMQDGQCDALLLAYAGVHRMEYDDQIAQVLSLDTFTPAVGQGTIAIECAVALEKERKTKIKEALNDPATETCLKTERAFLKKLEGGCSIPVFGLATLSGNQIHFRAGIINLSGRKSIRIERQGPMDAPEALGLAMAEELLEAGAEAILKEIKGQL